MINSNKGMFLETLINQTAFNYYNNGICAIFKREIPIKIISNDGNFIKAKLNAKSESDYYGVYKSKMFDFEAKQTIGDDFNMNLIKKHQLDHLINITKFGVHSFLLVHFVKYDEYYILTAKQLEEYVSRAKISYEWIKENGYKLELIFPGILNLEEYLKKIL